MLDLREEKQDSSQNKKSAGKSVEEIADMLEETPEKIQNIYELARNMEPDYDVEKICGQLSR